MNGDSIVAYVHDSDNQAVIGLEEPMKVTLDKEHQYVLTPYMPFSPAKVHPLDVYHILMESEIDNEIKATYMRLVLDLQDIDYDMVSDTDTLH